MKEKVIEILKSNLTYAETLYFSFLSQESFDKVTTEIDTLYRGEIDKLKEIIQAQDVLNKVYAFTDIIEPPGEDNIMKLKKKIAELKQEAGL